MTIELAVIDWLIIGLFIALLIFINFRYAGEAGKDLGSFFLGGRNLPWYIAGLSMVATTFAADTPLAVTELVAGSGIAGNWLWWNFLIGGMLTTFFFARLWRRSGVLTEMEFISVRYGSRMAPILRGFRALQIGLFMNAVIIAWVNLAFMSILETFFHVTPETALVITAGLMGFVAVYSAVSGLKGIAVSDAVQFFIAMAGSIILAVIVLASEKTGGIPGLKAALPESTFRFFPVMEGGEDVAGTLALSGGAFLAYLGFQWWASWYPGAEPGGGGYIAQRMLGTKNEKHALWATLFFQIGHYVIRPWPWILVGLASLVLYPNLEDARMGYVFAMRDFLPTGLKGLMLVAFLAAYMSTISTQLNLAASFVVNDFYKLLSYEDDNKKLVMVSRIATILIMIFGLFITTQLESIESAWKFVIECGAGVGLVLILRWYWWRINAWAEIAATVIPYLIYGGLKWMQYEGMVDGLAEFPTSFFITIGGTTLGWIIVMYLTPPEPLARLEDFYRKVRPGGFWYPVTVGMQGMKGTQRKTLWLFGCWIGSLVMTYSMLFSIGKFIFMEWMSGAIWLAASIAGFFMLKFSMKEAGFDEEPAKQEQFS